MEDGAPSLDHHLVRERRSQVHDEPRLEVPSYGLYPRRTTTLSYLVMACIVMACIVTAYTVIAYIVTAYIVMSYIVMAYIHDEATCYSFRTAWPCAWLGGGVDRP